MGDTFADFHRRSRSFKRDELRTHFLNLVTDENLREKVSRETDRLRDVIVALAFGSLAEEG